MQATVRNEPASVITCDIEGRIETFNEGAREIFGYQPDEVVGRRRVSLFSDGLTVLGHVPRWLDRAVKDGAFETDTAFRRKDGSLVAARIRITPIRKGGVHVGYCGVTRLLDGVAPAALVPPPSLGTRLMRWLVVTRAPFLTATIVPVLVGAAVAYREAGVFSGLLFALTLVGALLVHLGTNMANDYFDWTSGADAANVDYVVPFSGGSRSIELGLITPPRLRRLALACFGLGAAIGLTLTWLRGWPLLAIGVLGVFLGYAYTAPPVRLCARKGLGELAVGLGFGPLVVAGTYLVQTGRVSAVAIVASLPVALLVTAILYINEFPDHDGDKASGKNNLVVVLGRARAIRYYLILLALAYAIIAAGAATGLFPRWSFVALAGGLFAWRAARVTVAHFADRQLRAAQANTIAAHLVTGLLLAVAFAT